MADTFHHFGKLPRELRDEIWSLAVGPAQSGVHVFPVYGRIQGDKDLDPPKRETLDAMLRCGSEYKLWKSGLWLYKGYKGKRPVVGGDDGGMRTACTESRLMMEKHTKESWETYFDNEFTAFLTYMFPPANFFYLAPIPYELEPITMHNDHRKAAFDDAGLVIEYNSEWGLEIAGKRISELKDFELVKSFTETMGTLHGYSPHGTTWFVDYNIKRAPYVPNEEEREGSDVVFCTGNRRFLDVNMHRSKWNLRYRNQAGVDISADAFLEQFGNMYETPHYALRSYWCSSWGLLACEYI
ncbi:hypothetical protein ACHAPJ_003273 [Fusarium lateritium]